MHSTHSLLPSLSALCGKRECAQCIWASKIRPYHISTSYTLYTVGETSRQQKIRSIYLIKSTYLITMGSILKGGLSDFFPLLFDGYARYAFNFLWLLKSPKISLIDYSTYTQYQVPRKASDSHFQQTASYRLIVSLSSTTIAKWAK